MFICSVLAATIWVNTYKKCHTYLMRSSHSVDIDNELDFMIAETVMKHLKV